MIKEHIFFNNVQTISSNMSLLKDLGYMYPSGDLKTEGIERTTSDNDSLYSSGSQTVVREPPVVREQVIGGSPNYF